MPMFPRLALGLLACLGASAALGAAPGTAPGSPYVHITGADEIPLMETGEVTPLRLFIFLHDDVVNPPVSPADDPFMFHAALGDDGRPPDTLIKTIHDGYIGWWLDELQQMLPGQPIRVTYLTDMPGLTDIRHGHDETLADWSFALRRFAEVYGLPWMASYRNKFILLVPENVGFLSAGKAYREGAEAVASLTGPWNIVAHEVGHLLGATHEDAETRATDWWWCQTTMTAIPVPFLNSCYAYSAANRRRIQDYYHLGPALPRAQGQVAGPVVD